MKLSLAYATFSLLFGLTGSVPSVDMGYAPYARASRNGIQGADAITAVGLSVTYGSPYLSSSSRPGEPGLAVISQSPNPTTFFLKNGELYAYVNQTAVLHVNIIDPVKTKTEAATAATQGEAAGQVKLGSAQIHTEELPHRDGLMKVKLGTKKEGIKGMFYYVLDTLNFSLRQGGSTPGQHYSNGGLWWVCEEVSTWDGLGGKALYVDFGDKHFKIRPRPAGCEGFTLHSFGEQE